MAENSNRVNLILYTTLYRGGGAKFERVASTQYKNLRASSSLETIIKPIESKKDFLKAFDEIKAAGQTVADFYFYGHSGMYGIMFGTVAWPEQFSPFEWKQMELPVDTSSRFYFIACRSGRWFAPFIAKTLHVTAFGYHNYTTVSLSPDRFVWEGLKPFQKNDLYIIACPGKKSHGALASIGKYCGLMKADEFLKYEPTEEVVDTTYDSVAHLYENTFEDIEVRKDELNWLRGKFESLKPQKVLDIGCGNGSFLNQLSENFSEGQGVDLSRGMIEQAKQFRKANTKLSFQKIDGPHLPFPDNSFDVVMSTLAFRYLDWDPCISEILRVLKPGGRFLVLDMVAAPVKWHEYPLFIISKTKMVIQGWLNRKYYKALRKMVTSANWKKMLAYNPIRSEHEMKWYLESRFSGRKAQLLNVGWRSRILAFDTGPVSLKEVQKLQYP
jgi:ubiquinone/menaquinone biosynthesis C-methylase UbiE